MPARRHKPTQGKPGDAQAPSGRMRLGLRLETPPGKIRTAHTLAAVMGNSNQRGPVGLNQPSVYGETDTPAARRKIDGNKCR